MRQRVERSTMSGMETKTPLRELYDSVTKGNKWSQRDVEKRIADRGGQLSKSRINQIINAKPLESIAGDVIRTLALGLGISADRVALAAIQSMGFRVHGDSLSPAEAIARDETLSDDVRRSLLAILAAAEGRRGA
jgi:hypothetical protein